MKSRILTSLFAVFILATPASADMDDKEFVARAIEINLAEISLGKLSLEKSKDEKVRAYGEMMISAHSAANKQAENFAKVLSLTPPTQPAEKDQTTAEALAALTGHEFDAKFLEVMIKGHEEAIALYADQADGGDEIAKFAKDTLPELEDHLKQAQAIRG
ncbi:putative membrane protein [Rhodoligotrophos appendicifer]|uniref:DUF4142 domain-containing protein n=1 Tax=Rhodoligotrophos appendicifer TaxID=987056 RepID=UPI0011870442|nr:DUF4142 domain-containing protein [Rhodoligotrophos appendicifer]